MVAVALGEGRGRPQLQDTPLLEPYRRVPSHPSSGPDTRWHPAERSVGVVGLWAGCTWAHWGSGRWWWLGGGALSIPTCTIARRVAWLLVLLGERGRDGAALSITWVHSLSGWGTATGAALCGQF